MIFRDPNPKPNLHTKIFAFKSMLSAFIKDVIVLSHYLVLTIQKKKNWKTFNLDEVYFYLEII